MTCATRELLHDGKGKEEERKRTKKTIEFLINDTVNEV